MENRLSSRRGLKGMSDTNLLTLITVVVFVLMYALAVITLGSGFLKPQNFLNILNENASLIILSCGMSLVMITGGIDISVGQVTSLVCMSAAVYLDMGAKPGNVPTSICIALAIGLAFGLVQGFLVAYLEIQPFIVSLAGLFFAKGLTTIVNATQFNVENKEFIALKNTRITIPFLGSYNKKGVFIPAYIEIGVVIAIVVVILLFVLLRWTRLGRNFYAVGGNNQSARAIGGYVYFMQVGSGSPSHADGAEMNAIASSIIGGTMLTGGVGNIIGTFFGVLSLSTIKNIVSSLGLDEAWWTNITVAFMLCLFLLIQSLVLRRKAGAKK